MIHWLKKQPPLDVKQLLARLDGKSIILHSGFPPDWLPELLRQPGGGGHIRINLSLQNNKNPTALEAFLYRHVVPLPGAIPGMVKIEQENIFIRGLIRAEQWMHSYEAGDLLNEINQRFHYRLDFSQATPRVEVGLDLNQNDILYDW